MDNLSGTMIISYIYGISWKNKNVVCRLQNSALVPEIFKFEKCVKHENDMTDDVIHSAQFYTKYINRAIWVNLQRRPLKLGRLIVLQETHLRLQKLCSHGNSLLSSLHSLDFNMWFSAPKTLNEAINLS